jgi:hypothetical protein
LVDRKLRKRIWAKFELGIDPSYSCSGIINLLSDFVHVS